MDIRSKLDYPAGDLTNFAAYDFVVDNVACASMEGFLQSLKTQDLELQAEICGLVGIDAKRWGETQNENWKNAQTLWWRGKAYGRHSQDYQGLLDRAYAELARNEKFSAALLATGEEILTHSIGRSDPRETILTELEFCSRLMELRTQLAANIPKG